MRIANISMVYPYPRPWIGRPSSTLANSPVNTSSYPRADLGTHEFFTRPFEYMVPSWNKDPKNLEPIILYPKLVETVATATALKAQAKANFRACFDDGANLLNQFSWSQFASLRY